MPKATGQLDRHPRIMTARTLEDLACTIGPHREIWSVSAEISAPFCMQRHTGSMNAIQKDMMVQYDTEKGRTGSTMASRCCQTNLPECVSGDLAFAPAWDSAFTMISCSAWMPFIRDTLTMTSYVLGRPWQPIPREQLQCSQSLVAVEILLGILGALTYQQQPQLSAGL